MSCLDVGCGSGATTIEIARLIGPNGRVVGLDFDSDLLELARQDATDKHVDNAFFVEANVTELEDVNLYDFIYCRFLLSHLQDPAAMVAKLFTALKAKGTLVIEDVDFRGHFSQPKNAAFDRYVDLYQQLAKKNEHNPVIGRKLHSLLTDAGLVNIEITLADLVFDKGEGKTTARITLDAISPALLKAKLVEKAELTTLGEELDKFTKSKRTLISMPRIFQVWGTKVK